MQPTKSMRKEMPHMNKVEILTQWVKGHKDKMKRFNELKQGGTTKLQVSSFSYNYLKSSPF
jgi:hypothetical protein